ncbi:hypothetical protein LX83_001692 [Goodfellowiella coeruleoviolacea]|uniref:Uncharacterized protein n=1 Tax=Goodfellowiella coeruleoviolacea TaxID=334858 RepID=A0AAE3GAS7_9PSEU|nr:hypothetical protein [Goodfellowiella coeruleoviolacea]
MTATRRTYPTHDQATAALARYLATRRGRLRRWWLARRGRVFGIITCRPAPCGCAYFRVQACRPESSVWGRR